MKIKFNTKGPWAFLGEGQWCIVIYNKEQLNSLSKFLEELDWGPRRGTILSKVFQSQHRSVLIDFSDKLWWVYPEESYLDYKVHHCDRGDS